jgi:uncharacterized membrane protein YidH (DUF202 family)
MIELHNYSLPTIFIVAFAIMVASCETGRWLATKAVGKRTDTISTLQSAVFGLLALMIGFTFAVALSRFEARRDAVLNEANAIGTTALRAPFARTAQD